MITWMCQALCWECGWLDVDGSCEFTIYALGDLSSCPNCQEALDWTTFWFDEGLLVIWKEKSL